MGLAIKKIELRNFKAFERFSATFQGSAVIVGPNNAGKSTILVAIRTAAFMLRGAVRRGAANEFEDRGEVRSGHFFNAGQFSLVHENLKHEFREEEVRMIVTFSNDATLTAVWPVQQDQPDGFYYLQLADGYTVRAVSDVRLHFPQVGVIPLLSPLEQEEERLDSAYVRRNIDGRLASRHFRNQVALLEQEDSEAHSDLFEEYIDFVHDWTPEIEIRGLQESFSPSAFDLFYREPSRRTEKELFWAGDGVQVWLQLLYHVHRLRGLEVDTILLDEPDLYLHADLQRRLVALLESTPAQTITATHSAEMLGEFPQQSLVWVDKSRRAAVSAPDNALLDTLSNSIGTQFNLRLAKALKAKAVVFVEGSDMTILRSLAKTLGADGVSKEVNMAIVPLGGFSHHDRIAAFRWLNDKFLADSVNEYVILDRDYRTQDQVDAIVAQYDELGATCHIWSRKELESYLLCPTAIARVGRAEPEWIEEQLLEIADGMEHEVLARVVAESHQGLRDVGDRVRATEEASAYFREAWADPQTRVYRCPAKGVLTELNKRLTIARADTAGARRLGRELRVEEIDSEMAGVITDLDGLTRP